MNLEKALSALAKNHQKYKDDNQYIIGMLIDDFIGFLILEIQYNSETELFEAFLTGGYPYHLIGISENHTAKNSEDLSRFLYTIDLNQMKFMPYDLSKSTKGLTPQESLPMIFPDLKTYFNEDDQSMMRHFFIEAKIRIDEINGNFKRA